MKIIKPYLGIGIFLICIAIISPNTDFFLKILGIASGIIVTLYGIEN